jgi:hypothetical protein
MRTAVLEIVNVRVALVEPWRQTTTKLTVNIYLKEKKMKMTFKSNHSDHNLSRLTSSARL